MFSRGVLMTRVTVDVNNQKPRHVGLPRSPAWVYRCLAVLIGVVACGDGGDCAAIECVMHVTFTRLTLQPHGTCCMCLLGVLTGVLTDDPIFRGARYSM